MKRLFKNTPRQKITSVKDVMTFGKFRGNNVEDILHDEPEYLEWAFTEGVIDISPELWDVVCDCLSYPQMTGRHSPRETDGWDGDVQD